MKAIKFLIFIGLFMASNACCCVDFGKQSKFMRSFVTEYYTTDSIELKFPTYVNGYTVIAINSTPVGIYSYPQLLCGNGSNGQEGKLYDELCLKHNDMSYNKTFKLNNPGELPRNEYMGLDFASIRVVSDSDFDKEHPAGTDLGDVIIYFNHSVKKFIDSGYTELAPNGSPDHYFEKKVSKLTVDDLTLLVYYSLGNLLFESLPTLSQTHHLTVTMTTDDGKEFSASIDIDFGA
jgi:hypothetical protein